METDEKQDPNPRRGTMATLTISTSTQERESALWEGKDIPQLLLRLGEMHQEVGALLTDMEARELPIEQIESCIRDGRGWSGGGGYRSRDVDLEVIAPKDLLVRLVSCTEFRAEWLDGPCCPGGPGRHRRLTHCQRFSNLENR
jgi:hypothetical protein